MGQKTNRRRNQSSFDGDFGLTTSHKRRRAPACAGPFPSPLNCTPPMAFWILPAVFSALPSDCILASPTTLPTTSLTEPLTSCAAPAIRSLSMSITPSLQRLSRPFRGRLMKGRTDYPEGRWSAPQNATYRERDYHPRRQEIGR